MCPAESGCNIRDEVDYGILVYFQRSGTVISPKEVGFMVFNTFIKCQICGFITRVRLQVG